LDICDKADTNPCGVENLKPTRRTLMKRMMGLTLCALTLGLVMTLPARAGGVGAGVKVGTLGAGADLTVGILPVLNVRAGFNYWQYDFKTSQDTDQGSAEIGLNMKWQTIPILLDLHPFQNNFRISGGMVQNNNKFTMKVEPGKPVELNDQSFDVSDFTGEIKFDQWAPYAGIGYGNAVGKDQRWCFAFDLGVMFQGKPQASARLTTVNPNLQGIADQALDVELADIQSDTDSFQLYPVVAFGVSYKF
jgi:hypothetical protein